MKNSEKKKTVTEDSAQPSSMPLFFSKPVLLTTDRHAEAGIRLNLPQDFARSTNSIPVSVAEFIEAAKHYPIVFNIDAPIVPVVITGLEKTNYFIEEDGYWAKGVYIPAYVRKYPFIFMENRQSNKLMLCVDEDAPQYLAKAEGENSVRFYENNEPTEYTRIALNFCAALQEQHAITRKFCEVLQELDLLQPNKSEAKLANGKSIVLGGFQIIDAQKLKNLPDEKILELNRQGWLPLIHYCMLAASNWSGLLEKAEERAFRAAGNSWEE